LNIFLRSKKYYFLFFFSCFVWIGLLHYIDKLYQVKKIEVIGVSETETFIGISQFENKYIWVLEEERISQILDTINPSYKVAEVRKQYPNSLVIIVHRRYPSAYIEVGNGYLLLSKEGAILQKHREIEQESVPVIHYYQNIPYATFQAGTNIDKKDIRDALYFLEVIKGAKEKVVRIDIAGYHMLGLYTDTHEYFFSSEKNREVQLYQFEQVLTQLQIQGSKFKRIDFRFDKPVVIF